MDPNSPSGSCSSLMFPDRSSHSNACNVIGLGNGAAERRADGNAEGRRRLLGSECPPA